MCILRETCCHEYKCVALFLTALMILSIQLKRWEKKKRKKIRADSKIYLQDILVVRCGQRHSYARVATELIAE